MAIEKKHWNLRAKLSLDSKKKVEYLQSKKQIETGTRPTIEEMLEDIILTHFQPQKK